MPRFGWKCFIGSFLFSLAMVFATAKVYFLLPQTQNTTENNFDDIQTKNIALFAETEETNPIAEKFAQISGERPNLEQNKEQHLSNHEKTAETSQEVVEQIAENNVSTSGPQVDLGKADNSSEILFAPDDDDFEDETTDAPFKNKQSYDKQQTADNDDDNANLQQNDENFEIADAENEEPLQIADASEAKMFSIPIMHNFSEPEQNIKISSEADDSQVALASNNVSLQNLGTTNRVATASVDTTPLQDGTMTTNDYSDPWVVATAGNEHASKNKIAAKEAQTEDLKASVADLQTTSEPVKSDKEPKVAYKMMKNILIPIPEDIANDENLTPQLSYSEENKELSKRLMESGEIGDTAAKTEPQKQEEVKTTPVPKAESTTLQNESSATSSQSLTDSIAAWFASGSKEKSTSSDKNDSAAKNTSETGESAFGKLLGLGRKSKSNIAPSELKLAFQPNRAEISGQTLEWLRAFSDNAVKNEDVFIEIRIDGSGSFELQQKRLNLLYSILVNNGVDYNKINIIFTDREPNSFIIRNVRYASEEDANKARKKAYNPWY